MGTLYICPTPIGNLEDVSQRLIDVLNNVDLIYCEDTRRAKKLLNHFGIETGIESYFIGNEVNKIEEINECCVFGISDEYWGNKVCMEVYLGKNISSDDIKKRLKDLDNFFD